MKENMKKHADAILLSAIIVLAAVCVFLTYGMFIEPGWIQKRQYDVQLANYPTGAGVIRVLQMSDFHRGPFTGDDYIKNVVELGNGTKPDIILLTGDYVSESPNYISSVAAAIAGLKAPLGVYAVLGNSDYLNDGAGMASNLESSGVKVITNKSARIKNNLWIVGIDDCKGGNPDVNKAFAGVPAGAACIVITHNPAIIKKISGRGCLVLASDAHMSGIDPPVLHLRIHESLKSSNYTAGWYRRGATEIYISRGIGMAAFPIRFNTRPEITLFKIKGK
jgi:uncharacterized protein